MRSKPVAHSRRARRECRGTEPTGGASIPLRHHADKMLAEAGGRGLKAECDQRRRLRAKAPPMSARPTNAMLAGSETFPSGVYCKP